MKTIISALLLFSTVSAFAGDCSVAVGIVPRTGLIYRTWTNALETEVLEDKGFNICQDDDGWKYVDPWMVTEVTDPEPSAGCKGSEFKLELVYREDKMTRHLLVYKAGKTIYERDFPNSPVSTKILRTLPTCQELQSIRK